MAPEYIALQNREQMQSISHHIILFIYKYFRFFHLLKIVMLYNKINRTTAGLRM